MQEYKPRTMVLPYNLAHYDFDIETFNIIAGKQKESYSHQDIDNQCKLIVEEAKETWVDIQSDDPVGVLDGFCDVMYVTLRLGQMLESMGFDIRGAMQATAKNNLSKFIPKDEHDRVRQTLHKYNNSGETVFAELDPDSGMWVIKNTNDKVMKPFGFVSNNLDQFVPPELRDGGFKE